MKETIIGGNKVLVPTTTKEAMSLNWADRWFSGKFKGYRFDWYRPREWPFVHQRAVASGHPNNMERVNLITYLYGNGYPIDDIRAFVNTFPYSPPMDGSGYAQMKAVIDGVERGGFAKYQYYDMMTRKYEYLGDRSMTHDKLVEPVRRAPTKAVPVSLFDEHHERLREQHDREWAQMVADLEAENEAHYAAIEAREVARLKKLN